MSAERMPIGMSYFVAGHGEPAELNRGSGDVIFPCHWTMEMAAKWREQNLTPGVEWPRVHAAGQGT